MDFDKFYTAFPDFNDEGLVYSHIPRVRILFAKNNFRGMQKSLASLLEKLFSGEESIYTLNQLYGYQGIDKKVWKAFVDELTILGIGEVYNYSPLEIKEFEGGKLYNRIINIDSDLILKIATIDAWGRTTRGELHGLPFIEMDNIFFFEKLSFLLNINFILLNTPDNEGVDISSYDKAFLYEIASYFEKNGFIVLTDSINSYERI